MLTQGQKICSKYYLHGSIIKKENQHVQQSGIPRRYPLQLPDYIPLLLGVSTQANIRKLVSLNSRSAALSGVSSVRVLMKSLAAMPFSSYALFAEFDRKRGVLALLVRVCYREVYPLASLLREWITESGSLANPRSPGFPYCVLHALSPEICVGRLLYYRPRFIRSQPTDDGTHNVISALRDSSPITVIGRSADRKWLAVSYNDTIIGWVSAIYVGNIPNVDELPVYSPEEISSLTGN